MNRRDLLKMIVAATGVAFVGANSLAYELTFATPVSNTGFSKEDLLLMNNIGEVIIPKTDSPGAKDADVASMMAVMVKDCYAKPDQAVFKAGLVDIEKRAQAAQQKPFAQLSSSQKMSLLNELDALAKNNDGGVHYFSMIKQQVLFCFFTSQTGATKVLRHVAIPGRYDGDFPYKKGDKAWF
jgi:hypothetical protein